LGGTTTRDHATPRAEEGLRASLAIPPPTFRPAHFEPLGSLPFVSISLVGTFYPASGSGTIQLYRTEQTSGDDPTLRILTGLKLAPFTCDTDVPDMAAYWLRAMASACDWPSLIAIARQFRTAADRARDAHRSSS
jgi:hypothetical protein